MKSHCSKKNSSAVVFAYHNVGVRCLKVLLDQGIDILLIVSHQDNPQENIWFESVAEVALVNEIPIEFPDNPNTAELVEKISGLNPDFIFSFYYRHMLKPALLNIPKKGAFNMHGSLLPKFRGRVPVNWAIIMGEKETGATLHMMHEKPDYGPIVYQSSVPILGDDTALEVFNKVTVAAELTLNQALPLLLSGEVLFSPQNHRENQYFKGRKPEDGLIDWQKSALNIHNLVRAVAPPYPGALTLLQGKNLKINRTKIISDITSSSLAPPPGPCLFWNEDKIFISCSGGGVLRILDATWDGLKLSTNLLKEKGAYSPLSIE